VGSTAPGERGCPVSDLPRSGPEYITAAELADYGFTVQDVCRTCPQAVEYTSLDGTPCWQAEDLVELLKGVGS
jgi:hypothetical protein